MRYPKRCDVSEMILAILMTFTFMLLTVCPGGFLWFLLPPPYGLIAALCCGACGPWLMWSVDKWVYGPRQSGPTQ